MPQYGKYNWFYQQPGNEHLNLFYEYFHGDNGMGLGACHQTGWTACLAELIAAHQESILKRHDRTNTGNHRGCVAFCSFIFSYGSYQSKTLATCLPAYSQEPVLSIDKIPQSGSIRIYYRIRTAERSFIATYGINIKENLSFINFSRHFKTKDCPVPEIYAVNTEGTLYIQEDFGDISLLNRLEESGPYDEVYDLFRKSLKALAHLQIQGDKGIGL